MGRVDQLSNERGLRGPAVEVVILVTGDVDAQAGAPEYVKGFETKGF